MSVIQTAITEEMKIACSSDVFPGRIPLHVLRTVPYIISKVSYHKQNYALLLYTITNDRERLRHSIDTMLLSVGIAIKMGMSQDELVSIGISALMHDIGFSCLPEMLRGKEGTYSETEKLLVGVHTIVGYLMLSNNEQNITAEAIISGTHHEHINEQGLPDSGGYGIHTNFAFKIKEPILIANDIKQSIEIISVADRYTALRSERAHRKEFNVAKAVSEILVDAYNHYINSNIVLILLNIISNNRTVRIFNIGDIISIPSGLDSSTIEGIIINIDKHNPMKLECTIGNKNSWIDLTPNVN